jgi:hypothetical protein
MKPLFFHAKMIILGLIMAAYNPDIIILKESKNNGLFTRIV